MNDYYDFFWYQLCLNVQSMRDSSSKSMNSVRTYNVKQEHYERFDFDDKRVYLQLTGIHDESVVYISRYDFYRNIDDLVNKYEDDKQELKQRIIDMSDDVLGDFILMYIDKVK